MKIKLDVFNVPIIIYFKDGTTLEGEFSADMGAVLWIHIKEGRSWASIPKDNIKYWEMKPKETAE
jgi:hypothetical protein